MVKDMGHAAGDPMMLKPGFVKRASLALLMLSWLTLLNAARAADLRVPNASLKVTVRQKEDGVLGKGLHVFHLLCWDGQCGLTALSLNQCAPAGSGKPAF